MADLAKQLRAKDFRNAVKAIGEMSRLDPAARAALVPTTKAKDEQRAFQFQVARIVADGGASALAARWKELASPEWRENLVSAIAGAFHTWVSEGSVDALITALGDPVDNVARQSVTLLTACLREPTARERKDAAKTLSGTVALETFDRAAQWMTTARRERITQLVTDRLARRAANPKALTWPDWYIELLGHSATRADQRSIAVLEGFRPMAGEPRRTEFEKLDPWNLPWPTSVLAEKRGIPPGTPFVRIWSLGTGLLDLKNLQEALARIRARA